MFIISLIKWAPWIYSTWLF